MPRDPQPTKDRLLASAERLFAANGFDGVSMRDIAAEAQAHLALIHYHFGGKLEIYRAIWASRYAPEVTVKREAGFAAIDYSSPRPELIRALVELFLLPLIRITENEKLKDFGAIGARESTDPKEAERGILEEFLDPTAKRFLECFGKALPELTPAEVAWGYQAMVGISVQHIADRDRITRISNGAARAGDGRAAAGPLVDFCVGGWLALSERHKKQPGKPNGRSPSKKADSVKSGKLKNGKGPGKPLDFLVKSARSELRGRATTR